MEQGDDVYYCEVNSLPRAQWSTFKASSRNSYPAAFGQQLIAIDESTVFALSSLTQSWVPVGSTLLKDVILLWFFLLES